LEICLKVAFGKAKLKGKQGGKGPERGDKVHRKTTKSRYHFAREEIGRGEKVLASISLCAGKEIGELQGKEKGEGGQKTGGWEKSRSGQLKSK